MRWRICSTSGRGSRRMGLRTSFGGGPSTNGSRRSRCIRCGPLAARASASSLSWPVGPDAPGGRARRRNSRCRPSSSGTRCTREPGGSSRRSNSGEAPMPASARILQRQRHPQALTPVLDGVGLLVGRRRDRRQRALHQHRERHQPLRGGLLEGPALLLDAALEEPRRAQRKCQQHHHDGDVDAQVQRLHCVAAFIPGLRRPACVRTRSRHRAP